MTVTSLAVSSRAAQRDAGLYAAGYDAAGWSGAVTAYKLMTGTAKRDPEGLWHMTTATPSTGSSPARPPRPRTTADIMDAHDSAWPDARVVLSSNTKGPATASGIPWTWDKLPSDRQTDLMTIDGVLDTSDTAESSARARMAYLRGDRSREQGSTPPGPFRNRVSRHGDVVHSKLWYLAGMPSGAYTQEDYAGFRAAWRTRASMLYVGANDGMLHGFDAAGGEERIAYVPEGLSGRLAQLTSPAYSHASYVDGSPFTGDLYLGPPGSNDANQWRTYLAGFPGAGGKGYFVLDVTDPAAFNATNAAGIVVMDTTDTKDADIGRILADPVTEAGDPSISRQITRMNNGRWALVMGNGHDSTNEQAVLLIQFLDGDKALVKLKAGDTRGNGLSAPRLVDLNGNRIPDVAYAGDLRGNLWKFDLSAADSHRWNVAFSGRPLFVARDGTPAALRQPITAAPVWKAHPQGGGVVAFGTGRRPPPGDRADEQPQSVYGVRDDTPIGRPETLNAKTWSGTVEPGQGSGPIAGRHLLVEQTITVDAARRTGTVSSHSVPYSAGDARRGWFIDLPAPGERVLRNLGWFDGALIDVWSTVPASGADPMSQACDPLATAGMDYRTTIDILNGAAPKSRLYEGLPATTSGQPSRIESGRSIEVRDDTRTYSRSLPGEPSTPSRNRLARVSRRASWRQLQ